MISVGKISAVRDFLSQEFPNSGVLDHYEPGKEAQCFEVTQGKGSLKAVISEEFLEDHTEDEIRVLLKKFLLVEHLRECDLPIIVTNEGLKI